MKIYQLGNHKAFGSPNTFFNIKVDGLRFQVDAGPGAYDALRERKWIDDTLFYLITDKHYKYIGDVKKITFYRMFVTKNFSFISILPQSKEILAALFRLEENGRYAKKTPSSLTDEGVEGDYRIGFLSDKRQYNKVAEVNLSDSLSDRVRVFRYKHQRHMIGPSYAYLIYDVSNSALAQFTGDTLVNKIHELAFYTVANIVPVKNKIIFHDAECGGEDRIHACLEDFKIYSPDYVEAIVMVHNDKYIDPREPYNI